ncbi:PLP-dependent aminotransferase family protein [Streptococcus equinus]|uniref:MocR-like pyridoxine biosynthesis transcription factor PdxR n=1 Tax=Streptococcus equinus TaxID=1335 RepID=UPI00195CDF4D|nr:PLP-dependent aminotransferase family protein [Streptococcus equinus]
MLTYSLDKKGAIPLYEQLYRAIKKDITIGILKAGEKLPSKRNLAKHLGISIVTVETSYQQLKAEGYIYSQAKKGFFVSEINPHHPPVEKTIRLLSNPESRPDEAKAYLRLSNNQTNSETFPFATWSKIVRQVLNNCQDELVHPSPSKGVLLLRQAIAKHLNDYRGMAVDPRQIIIGAGTEYLYTILIQLLGLDKTVALEEPSYSKIRKIYQQFHVKQTFIDMEKDGLSMSQLKETDADIVHLSPSHQFPTGAILSISKRYELLSWANQGNRYIIEDDYDSEFRFQGLPIPSLQEIDSLGKVIYINTFSKSLASTLRISYMILPPQLLERFEKQLSFYNNTVSNLQQYTLAYFINDGYFEKHLNRMRLFYQKKRDTFIQKLLASPLKKHISIHDEESGLHFIMTIKSDLSEDKICQEALANGLQMTAISHYYQGENKHFDKSFIVNYANISNQDIKKIINILSQIIL